MSEEKFLVDYIQEETPVNPGADVFNTLYSVDVSNHIEKKNGLSYVSWAWAWAEVKKKFPRANYKIYESEGGRFYFTDGRTCWVKTGVTIEGIEHIEYLPVMDFRNKSIPVDKIESTDVNKTIQRSLTKAAARHGLGLFVYAGEDLPETSQDDINKLISETRTMLKAMGQDETRLFKGRKLEDMSIDELTKNNALVKKEYDKRNGISG